MQKELPRLPLDGSLDLTYRCNNICRHCWLWEAQNSSCAQEELSFEELRRIVDEARQMGCQAWAISGGEPMLRPDFADIFDYITRKAVTYSLNTNGTLITPEIARLLTRKGNKMVALYGATPDVHDHVTRNPGSYEATMRGFAYLQEAGASFTVQIVPMRDNYHQYNEMLALARSLSSHYRVGAAWLWLSACASNGRNREIAKQRLEPEDVIVLDQPYPDLNILAEGQGQDTDTQSYPCGHVGKDDRLFASCIAARRDFHIDPYGGMSFCYYIKDPALRYDLRQGSFQEAWDEFIPSLADAVHGGQEYFENCGSCELRDDCRWCAVYGYLEHRRYSARVEYLCQVAKQARQFKEDWKLNHIRYFQVAGITIQLSTDHPITDDTFSPAVRAFQVEGPGPDTISLSLHSPVPASSHYRLGKQAYRVPPWTIYHQGSAWAYLGIANENQDQDPFALAIFDENHNKGSIYRNPEYYSSIGKMAITAFPTDQILLAQILSNRKGCLLHSSAIIIDGKGLLFVGHSEAGKSTMLKILRGQGEILCDDRNIIRRWPDGFYVHGTWNHGELPDVSPAGAPLQAILFLDKADENRLIPITNKQEYLGSVLSHVVKSLATSDWWEKTLDLAGEIVEEVPAYRLRFDKSGRVVDLIDKLVS